VAVTVVAPALPSARIRRRLVLLLSLALAALATVVLYHVLQAYSAAEIVAAVRAVGPRRIAVAFAFTAADYGALYIYDWLALVSVRHLVWPRRIALASMIGCALSHVLSWSAVTGGSIRYRFWSGSGLTASESARAIGFLMLTQVVGLTTIAGAAMAAGGLTGHALGNPMAPRALGACMLGLVAVYVLWGGRARPLVSLGLVRLALPSRKLATAQVGASLMEWTLAGSVLYVLIVPVHGLAFPTFLGWFFLAQAAGIVTQLPGGIGVFDATMLLFLRAHIGVSDAAAAIVVYRGVYYLVPLTMALITLVGLEVRRRWHGAARIAHAAFRSLLPFIPSLVSGATFLAGVVLLASGAIPPVRSRLLWLGDVLPLSLIELSHFAGSVLGVGLLMLARGLQRRLDAAYHLTIGVLVAGIIASLVKGVDWEEAMVLSIVLAMLIASRRHFDRRAALLGELWSPGWIAAIVLVVGGSVWLGLVSYEHVAYSNELWWKFALNADAPRFLRASVGAVGVAVGVGLGRLFQPARPAIPAPTGSELDRAARIAYESGCVNAYLATLGDKALLFGEPEGLLMYAVSGRSWVALGDPVGRPETRVELAWRFRELVHRHGGWPVFYEVGHECLPLYVELGLALLKIGEEALVPLEGFSLDGGARKGMRRTLRDAEREGCEFALLPPAEGALAIADLACVSDAWLAAKQTREKQFSLGRFHAEYLQRFPIAVVRRGGVVIAFANVWLSAMHADISVDLMRYRPDAPHGVMDYMFVNLMLWARQHGYRRFSLGIAPLSGLTRRALAPLWSRAGAFLYGHAEHFYNFRGLRAYKDKFDPVWEPRYLASPGGLTVPRVLANVASLVSGGIGGAVAK
jgi:phosphatidylglycerol lysyltransferase